MKKLIKNLNLPQIFLIALPPALFFSYYPVISIAENSSMNFELSIPEIWLLLFFIVTLPQIPKLFKYFGLKKIFAAALVPTYFTISTIWSGNPVRTILTAAIFALLIYAALNLIYQLNNFPSLRRVMLKSLLVSALLISIFCWLQCILDLAGVSPAQTLLCRGCVSSSFGFPHPNGFAIEPQFMGNLLLAPALFAFYLISAPAYKNHKHRKAFILLALFLSSTIFITLSRGAIYAFIIGLIIEQVLIFLYNKKASSSNLAQSKKTSSKPFSYKIPLLKVAVVTIASITLALTAQGIFAATSPTSDTFITGVTKSIHQLTLGKIDLRPAELKVDPSDSSSQSSAPDEEQADINPLTTVANEYREEQSFDESSVQDDAHFSGYVEESTNIRLNLNALAFKTWSSSPQYILIGAGLGSAGTAMHRYAPEEIGPKEIVQNEYVSLLLETGLFGYLIIVVALTLFLNKKFKVWNMPLLIAILVVFAITLLFFSGLPNALHIYLFPLLFV